MKYTEFTKILNENDIINNRLSFVKRDYNELIKNENDEVGIYLKTVNLICNSIKLLGTIDHDMLRDEYEINTDKYKKLIIDLVNNYLKQF